MARIKLSTSSLLSIVYLILSGAHLAESLRRRAFMFDGRPPNHADCMQTPFASGCRGISAKRSSSDENIGHQNQQQPAPQPPPPRPPILPNGLMTMMQTPVAHRPFVMPLKSSAPLSRNDGDRLMKSFNRRKIFEDGANFM